MVRYSLIVLALAALMGCDKDEIPCEEVSCGRLVHKYTTFYAPMHRYIIERECDGSRFTKMNTNSIQYNQTYVGDHVCSSDFQ